MRVMVMVKATKNSEAGTMPSQKLIEDMGKFNEELVKAGIMQGGEGLHPTSKAKRIKMSGGKKTVVDGPFPLSNVVAGFWLWQVKDMDEAVKWAMKCPDPMPGEDAELEIRRIFAAEDFGDAMTPEMREKEDKLRATVEKQNAKAAKGKK